MKLLPLQDVAAEALVALLRETVAQGASIGWTVPPSTERALAFWRGCQAACARGERMGWAAVGADGQALGSAQLVLDMPENGRHRAEVCKVMVAPAARRQGLAEALMRTVEAAARAQGRSLLVLDTLVGSAAERLYRRLGFEVCGAIPAYAMSTMGVLEATQMMFKPLSVAP